MEQRPSVIPVENETTSTYTRTTVDGRSITYCLTVLQQPVRARACGQGAKSSADRRPVDPPPIVELTIHQGEKSSTEDITFAMNASYFLFATLEHARPIAQGRVSQEKSTIPVLTGSPVSGMVYLDRPKPAGYFIFPDLSVRHEGKYRLSFSLYEELKKTEDHDKNEDGMTSSSSEDHYVTHRLDVRSEPFHVYSAKKFPGLTESTSLSRMVAEQGCRVRIRRDVRMRRREPKGAKDWDDYEEETAAARSKQESATPDPAMYSMVQTPQGGYVEQIPRPRSASNVSHHSMGTAFSRRPSLQDIGQPYSQPQYPNAPHTSQHAYPQPIPYATSQPPQQQYQAPPFIQQQAPMQPPPPQYQAQNFAAPSAYPAPPAQTGYYTSASTPASAASQTQTTLPQTFDSAPQPPRVSMDYSSNGPQDYRRASIQHIPLPPRPPPQGGFAPLAPSTHATQQMGYSQPPPPPPLVPQHSSHQSVDVYGSNRPAPLEPLQPPARANGAHTPTSVKPSFDLPPLNTAMMSGKPIEASSPISSAAPQSSYFSNTHTPLDTHKRSFGNVFSDRHQSGPLRQGARPSVYGHADSIPSGIALSAADDDDNTSIELDLDGAGMHYRRADGRQIRRALPGHL